MVEVEFISINSKKSPKLFKVGKYSFSTVEIKHLLIAFVMLSVTLYFLQSGSIFTETTLFQKLFSPFSLEFFLFLIVFALAFLLHEFGHKFMAQHYGFVSEFRADFFMLSLTLVLAIFSPFILLAPGAVMILGRPTIRQNGIISLAGPLINFVQAIIYLGIFLALSPFSSPNLSYFLGAGVFVNAFLGAFNMIPFWVLDGKKILAWNWKIYSLLMAGLLYLCFFPLI